MHRPVWTFAFFIICILVLPCAFLTHVSVSTLIPAISDLPANLVQGFDEVFKFAYLEKDATQVRKSSAEAVQLCGVTDAAVTCPSNPQPDTTDPTQLNDINAQPSKTAITNAFANSLRVVQRVANDKYFGTDDLKETADNLNKIVLELEKISPMMKCYAAIPTFCGIYMAGDGMVAGVGQVQMAIDSFTNSDIVKQWDAKKGLLIFLHVLPYFIALSLAFFGIFWYMGGVCCCCRGGTKSGTLALIPSVLLWLVSFIIYFLVLVTGVTVKYSADRIEVPVLKGKPMLDAVIEHIQTDFSEFWNVVFADLEHGLDLLLTASYFVVVTAFLQFFYMSLECCCCPYRRKAGAEEDAAIKDSE
eukprot:TRINITY_DN82968_c0_g1_i1.p1 TRINITY_DN82968_c0_g1~~TRINITY_DN82968_c0_g1_i1.p1  ORF type:complete len:359 (+),score=46.93 TRINITY_DN82968_c0_g1_i1:90-1166(+)